MIRRVVALIGTASPRPDAGDRGVDADHSAAGVGERAAGVARVQRRVGLDDVLDDAGRVARADRQGPAEPADHAGGHAAGHAHRVAHRDHEAADPQVVGVAVDGRVGDRTVGADDGEVGQRVTPDDLETGHGAIGERRLAGVGSPDDVRVGDEVTLGGEGDGGPEASPGRPDRRTRIAATRGSSVSATPVTTWE